MTSVSIVICLLRIKTGVPIIMLRRKESGVPSTQGIVDDLGTTPISGVTLRILLSELVFS
jgi:hypothetical protein